VGVKTLVIVSALPALLAGSAAHADPLQIELKPATLTWRQKQPVDVTLKVTNTSKAEVKLEVMSCSWEDHWRSSDRELTWSPWGCDKNAPSSVVLAPGKSREWKLSMYATENAAVGAHPLAMTFTPRGGTATKSGAVTITVAR
jgi:uncharacterized membrane protein